MYRKLPPMAALRAFEAAAELMSFKAAAAQLHRTPSAISHQIRGLEEEMGTALFHREPHGLGSPMRAGTISVQSMRRSMRSARRRPASARGMASAR